MRKNFAPMKYPRERILDPQNTYEKKFCTHEIPTRKNFRPSKYPREKFGPHQIPTRKNFGPTKYPQEKILDPQRHDVTMARDPL